MIRERNPRLVGGITVAIVLVVLAALFAPSGLSLGQRSWYAELSQAGGLRPGDDVRVAGVSVGKVKSLKVRDARVRVSMRIRKSLRLGSATRANVKVATLLGNHYLELRPAGDGVLADRTIPLAQTSVPFEIQDVVQAGGTALEALDGAKLQAALKVLADDFRGTDTLTGPAFESIARLSDVVTTRKAQLGKLVDSAAKVTGNLDANRDQLVQLMQQASLILQEITARREAIRSLLTATQQLAKQLTGLVRDNQKTVTPLLAHLNTVLATLRANEAALDRIGVLLGPAARYFANATGNGPYMDLNGPNALVPDALLCVPQRSCQ